MRKYLLDTGVASDFINRRNRVYELARELVRGGARIGITVPILGELWGGVELSRTRERNVAILRQHVCEFVVWPYTDLAAEEFGRLYAELRRKGRPIQQIDLQIAAVARTLPNCTLVTKDSDFQAIEGLKLIDWTQTATE